MRSTDLLALALLLLAGCRVHYRVDATDGSARIDERLCVARNGAREFSLRASDKPWLNLPNDFTVTATLPDGATEGTAHLSYQALVFGASGDGQAIALPDEGPNCLLVKVTARQAHIAESMPVGPDGTLQRYTNHDIELGPWCVRECPEPP